jgi:hypothetical protein
MSLSKHGVLLIAITIGLVAVAFILTSPYPQDPAYHLFADTRTILAINNFWNVMSNLPFLLVGLWGLAFIGRHGTTACLQGTQSAYLVFFSGILLTAFGSGYYHLAPANDPLVWDRLPMTIGFAGLFSIIVGEFISVRAARRILIPLLLVGYASVEYWALTESRGVGDLRPYAVVQFLPMLLIPIILATRKPAIGATKYYWIMLLFYVVAKVFEQLDVIVYALGGLLSGHSIKHLFAALTPATVLYALYQRRETRHQRSG